MDKKLTTDRIKQLEDNANKMKEGGYSDEDIQEMSNQFIEEYGIDDTTTVKKKDIPTQSTFGGSVSPTQDTKTGVSATQSQPADPSVNNQFNMMSFRNPIPENPIAHEDKIAYAKKAYRNNPLVPQGISDEDLHTAIEKNVTKNPDAFNQLAHQVKQKEERDTHIANSSVDELMAQNNDELQHAYKTNTFYEYQQSRFGKAVSYLNDIKDGVNISEKDAEYIKSVAPTAFNELVPDGNLQAAINVNRANKQANDAANAVTFNEAKKAYLTQANVIDASQIATMSDQVKVGEVAAKQNQQKDIEIKNLQLKYPLRQIGNTNYYNEMSTQMDFPPEYYAELKKVNEKYDAIGNYLGGVHGTEFAKTQKDGIVSGAKSAYDIGIESLKIQNKNTYEQYLAGGQKSKEVKSIATKLGIESMLATGDPEIIRKAQIEQSEFFNKYPKELADDTIRRLSVEHFRNIGISNFDNNPMAGTEELDKLANNLPQQNRDYYYNVIRKNAIEQKSANSFNANIKSSTGVVQLMNPGGAVNSLLEGFINPIVSTGKLISDISNIRTKEQISNENLEGVPITKQPVFDKKSLNKRVDEIKAKPKKTYQDLVELQDAEENKSKIPWGAEYVNRISSTIGMVGSIALQSQMLAGVVGDIVGVSSEGLTAMQQGIQTETSAAEIAKYATQLKNIGAGTGQVAMAATMADDMYKSAIRLMPNDNQATQRVAYTALLTTMWGAVSRIMPFEKVFQGLTPEAESELANLAKEVTQKSVTKEALTNSLGKVLDKYILPFAKGTATDLAKVTAEMTGAQVITQAADAVANPSEFNPEAAKEAVVHTLLNTPIDMILVAGMNGIREVSKNPMSIATLSSLSNEKVGQQFIDVVQAQQQSGDITPKEATEKIQIVNTLQEISKKEIPEVQAIKSLTQKESDMYKVLLLNEKLLRKKMEDSKDAVLNKVYDSQIKESEAKRQNILGEEYIVDSNYNLKSVEDANIEMSDTESVTANGTPEVQGEPKTNTETIADDNQTKNAEVGSGSEASGMVDATTETAPISDEVRKQVESLDDEKTYTAHVHDISEIPEQFRDRAVKLDGEIKSRKSFLGIPYGKEETTQTYRYQFTGKEAKDELLKMGSKAEPTPTETAPSDKDSETKRNEDRKRRTRIIHNHLLDNEGDVDGAFSAAGYENIDGMHVHPDAINQYNRLSSETKRILKDNGIRFIESTDGVDLAGGHSAVISSNGKNIRGVGIADLGEYHTGGDHTAIHEAGHAIWYDLSQEERDLFDNENPLTEHGKSVKKQEGAYGELYKGKDWQVGEEDFADLFAINKGDLKKTISDKKAQKAEPTPTNTNEPSSKVSSGVEGDMEDTAKKLEKAIPKSDQMAEAVSALPAEGVINYKDIKTTITSSNYERYFNNPSALNEKARKIYDELIKGGKLRNEKILLSKDGELLDGTNRFKARLALGQTDFKFSIPNETFFTQPYTKTIAELYHKAKKDGSNPELVKVVEGSIAPQEVKPNEPIVEQSKAESKVNFEAKNNDNLGTPEVVVKNSDGEVIGNVTTSFDPKNENVLIVQSIDVKPGNQNKGIGKQLYLELAKNNPDKTIKSSPRLSGEYAIKAWESLVRDGIAEKVGENKYEINSKKEVANSEKLLKEKESEIENLKMEMEAKIRDLKKEKLDIDLPPIKKVAYSESPIENKEKLDSIKKRLSILDDIIKCL